MSYLFQVSIGPVQGFIASARRTRDLWFGSWSLSELAKAAAKQIVEVNGLESLIFPAPEKKEMLDPGTSLNVANKIVALIQQSPDELGKQVRQVIVRRLEGIRDRVYTQIGPFDQRSNAAAQINDLVEFLWVALPFEGSDYEGQRKQLEALMATRKNTRDFHQVTWGNNTPKSSIDGQLESVISEREYPNPGESDTQRLRKIRDLYEKYRAAPAERLSGVDLLKRRGASSLAPDFPSTSHMATIPFLERIKLMSSQEQTKAKEKWIAYIEKVLKIADLEATEILKMDIASQNQRVDIEFVPEEYAHPILQRYEGSLLFEERLVDLVDVVSNSTKFNEAKEALRGFFEFIDTKLGKARPSPYYAILLADGDRMGQVIDEQANHGYKQHRLLSQALDKFAGKVKKIVKDHQGALVYAGGDDVLAFVPLHKVLDCAADLVAQFAEALNDFADNEGHPPTLSVGIAIVHHLHSLRDALNLAREAEQRAKQVDGKNALAITISKRSGEDYMVAGKWGDLDKHLKQLLEIYGEEIIPAGTAYELRDMARRLTIRSDDPDFKSLQEVILIDAGRILHRKLHVSKDKSSKQKADEVENFLKARLGIAEKQPTGGKTVSIEQLINELIVAQALADAIRLTEPKKGA